jgi:hypothetical protein
MIIPLAFHQIDFDWALDPQSLIFYYFNFEF